MKKVAFVLLYMNSIWCMEHSPLVPIFFGETPDKPLWRCVVKDGKRYYLYSNKRKNISYFSRLDLKQLRELAPLIDEADGKHLIKLDELNLNMDDFATLMNIVGLSRTELRSQMKHHPYAVNRVLFLTIKMDYPRLINFLVYYHGKRGAASHGGSPIDRAPANFKRALALYHYLALYKPIFGIKDHKEGESCLQELSLQDSNVTHLDFNNSLFCHITNLDLSCNSLHLYENMFDSMSALRRLNLSSCGIIHWEHDVFNGLNALEQLILDANMFRRLPEDQLLNCAQLTLLSVKRCKNLSVLSTEIQSHPQLLYIHIKKSGLWQEDGTTSVIKMRFDKKGFYDLAKKKKKKKKKPRRSKPKRAHQIKLKSEQSES